MLRTRFGVESEEFAVSFTEVMQVSAEDLERICEFSVFYCDGFRNERVAAASLPLGELLRFARRRSQFTRLDLVREGHHWECTPMERKQRPHLAMRLRELAPRRGYDLGQLQRQVTGSLP